MRHAALVLAMILTVVPGLVSPTIAADICEAVVIRDVHPEGSTDYTLKAGEKDEAVTQYRVSKKTGEAVLCSHGGFCYPASALKLLNCKVGKKDTFDDPDDVYYSVDVIRSKNSAATLRYDDLDNQLLEMGMCSACAHVPVRR